MEPPFKLPSAIHSLPLLRREQDSHYEAALVIVRMSALYSAFLVGWAWFANDFLVSLVSSAILLFWFVEATFNVVLQALYWRRKRQLEAKPPPAE